MLNTKLFTLFIAITMIGSVSLTGCRKQPITSELPPQETSKPAETATGQTIPVAEPTIPTTPPVSIANNMPADLFPIDTRQAAPDFSLPNIDDSGPISLSSLKGKMILLDFTTTWCGWCEKQLPQVEDLYKNYEKKGFIVIAIDCREQKEDVLRKYSGGKNLYPVVLDTDGSISSNLYNVQGYPFYMLIDKTGKVAYVQSGYKEDMYDRVSKILDYLIAKEP